MAQGYRLRELSCHFEERIGDRESMAGGPRNPILDERRRLLELAEGDAGCVALRAGGQQRDRDPFPVRDALETASLLEFWDVELLRCSSSPNRRRSM
jgi:hypothetical protein